MNFDHAELPRIQGVGPRSDVDAGYVDSRELVYDPDQVAAAYLMEVRTVVVLLPFGEEHYRQTILEEDLASLRQGSTYLGHVPPRDIQVEALQAVSVVAYHGAKSLD